MAKDMKVIPSEECVSQHKLLICELRLKTPKPHPKPFSPKLRYWKLKEPTVQEEYELVFKSKVNAFNNVEASTEEIWNQLSLTPLMRPVVKRRNSITKGKPGGGMMKLIRLLRKKDGVGKSGSREVAKNNNYRPNEMRNEQFTLQRRPLKRRSFQT